MLQCKRAVTSTTVLLDTAHTLETTCHKITTAALTHLLNSKVNSDTQTTSVILAVCWGKKVSVEVVLSQGWACKKNRNKAEMKECKKNTRHLQKYTEDVGQSSSFCPFFRAIPN